MTTGPRPADTPANAPHGPCGSRRNSPCTSVNCPAGTSPELAPALPYSMHSHAAQRRHADVGVEAGKAHGQWVHGRDVRRPAWWSWRPRARVPWNVLQADPRGAVEVFGGIGRCAGVCVEAALQAEQRLGAAAQVFATPQAPAAGGVDAAAQAAAGATVGALMRTGRCRCRPRSTTPYSVTSVPCAIAQWPISAACRCHPCSHLCLLVEMWARVPRRGGGARLPP